MAYAESCEFDFVRSELEFVRVEDSTIGRAEIDVVESMPECRCHIIVPEDGIINTFGLASEVNCNVIKSFSVTIT